jgi:hypothetical protein
MQAKGWKVGQSPHNLFHHNAWAMLLVWEGEGVPPMPDFVPSIATGVRKATAADVYEVEGPFAFLRRHGGTK